MDVLSIPEQENKSTTKVDNNHVLTLHGLNGIVQSTSPDVTTTKPDSPVEVASDRNRSSSSSSEGDTTIVLGTAEEQEIGAEMDSFLASTSQILALKNQRELWEQKHSHIMKSKLVAMLKVSKKENDLTEFLEAAQLVLSHGQTHEWACIVLEAVHEVYKRDGCAILDAACLLNNNGRLDFWIAEFCAKFQKSSQEAFLEILNHSKGAFSPLHCAIRAGALETVRLLVKLGANVCKSNTSGQTPLMNAASLGHVYILEFLLENGAQPSIDAKDAAGRTAFYYAVDCDETAAARKLLASGATVTAHSDTLEALLRMAIVRTNPEMVELLLNAGMNPNELFYGEPALVAAIDHFALGMHHPIWGYDKERQNKAMKIIRLFVEHPQTNFNMRGTNGISALREASYHCFNDLKWELIEKGAVE
jgi:hypothetical protein